MQAYFKVALCLTFMRAIFSIPYRLKMTHVKRGWTCASKFTVWWQVQLVYRPHTRSLDFPLNHHKPKAYTVKYQKWQKGMKCYLSERCCRNLFRYYYSQEIIKQSFHASTKSRQCFTTKWSETFCWLLLYSPRFSFLWSIMVLAWALYYKQYCYSSPLKAFFWFSDYQDLLVKLETWRLTPDIWVTIIHGNIPDGWCYITAEHRF